MKSVEEASSVRKIINRVERQATDREETLARHSTEEKQPGCVQKSLTCTQLNKKTTEQKMNRILINNSMEKTHGKQIAH